MIYLLVLEVIIIIIKVILKFTEIVRLYTLSLCFENTLQCWETLKTSKPHKAYSYGVFVRVSVSVVECYFFYMYIIVEPRVPTSPTLVRNS